MYPPVLRNPDLSMLQTDASDRGVGVVLNQKDEDGEKHPVGYFSKNCCREKNVIQQKRRNVWY